MSQVNTKAVESVSESNNRSKIDKNLHYLNHEHDFARRIASAERFAGIPILKRIVYRIGARLMHFFGIESYFQAHAEYNARLVRCLNEMNARLDRDDRIADEDLRASFYSLEKDLFEKLTRYKNRESQGLNELVQNVGLLREEQSTMNSVVRGLERIVSLNNARGTDNTSTSPEYSPDAPLDYRYLLLENRYRGSEEAIRERVEIYREVFSGKGVKRHILEIGSGRGELQEVFREAGIKSYGVEVDPAMVALCESRGLDVRLCDVIEHMSNLSDQSLDGVIALQLVEHLSVKQLNVFLSLCRKKIIPGGKVVFETINTSSLVALCHNYFRDPTHTAPLHPDTMKEIVEQSGIEVKELRLLSPFPDGAKLKTVPIRPIYPPNFTEALTIINDNVEQLNTLLYDYQDYCLIAEV